jgi:hypothetical protein
MTAPVLAKNNFTVVYAVNVNIVFEAWTGPRPPSKAGGNTRRSRGALSCVAM